MKRISSELLCAVGGLLCFVVFSFVYAWPPGIAEDSVSDDLPTDAFEKGQYYFNSDDDPNGPYDLEKARAYYEAALAKDPQVDELAWYQLGRIDFLEGDFDTAIERFGKQREYFADTIPNVHYMLGLTYGYRARWGGRESDWQKAEDEFDLFIGIAPTAPWPRVDLAWVYFAQGKYEDMVPVLEEGLQYHPDNAWLLNMYGLALLNTGDRQKAHDVFVHAKESAAELSLADWGKTYPGNDPADWPRGLTEFRETIEKNRALTVE